MRPPASVIALAVECAMRSPCLSKRGAVVFGMDGDQFMGWHSCGWNDQPKPYVCDRSAYCKETCARTAIHAEEDALLGALGDSAQNADLLHVKAVNGALVASGEPSCVRCSGIALHAGIAGFWLYHADGWKRYEMVEFHRLSLKAMGFSLPVES